MENITRILFSLVFLITSCADNGSAKQRISDELLEEPELHIKDSAENLKHDGTILYTGWYYVVDTPNNYKRQLDKSTETYYLSPKPIVTVKNIASFEIYEESYNGNKYYGLTMRLDNKGTESWSYATRKAEVTGMQLAFILDNRLLQVAKVNSEIIGGVTALNRGDYSREELENFRTIINSER